MIFPVRGKYPLPGNVQDERNMDADFRGFIMRMYDLLL